MSAHDRFNRSHLTISQLEAANRERRQATPRTYSRDVERFVNNPTPESYYLARVAAQGHPRLELRVQVYYDMWTKGIHDPDEKTRRGVEHEYQALRQRDWTNQALSAMGLPRRVGDPREEPWLDADGVSYVNGVTRRFRVERVNGVLSEVDNDTGDVTPIDLGPRRLY